MQAFSTIDHARPTSGSGSLDVEGPHARVRRMDGQQRPRPQVRLAVAHQLVVRPVAHQLGQLGRIGDVERLDRDVRLGVAGAVPVEVVAARAPAAPVVLADRDLGVLRVVLPLHVAEGTPDRQLPADVGLGLERARGPAGAPGRAGRSRRRGGSRCGCGRCRRSGRRPRRCGSSPRPPRRARSSRTCAPSTGPAGTATCPRRAGRRTPRPACWSSLSAKCAPSVQQPVSGDSL